jgi:hypothetical protein
VKEGIITYCVPRTISNQHLTALKEDPVINYWRGYWGWKNKPTEIKIRVGDGVLPLSGYGDGSVSPRWRGPGQMKGHIIIQRFPGKFHDKYVKDDMRKPISKGGLLLP